MPVIFSWSVSSSLVFLEDRKCAFAVKGQFLVILKRFSPKDARLLEIQAIVILDSWYSTDIDGPWQQHSWWPGREVYGSKSVHAQEEREGAPGSQETYHHNSMFFVPEAECEPPIIQ